jgi:branched-chain amino acid transport system ATP-binding protein
LALSLTVQDVDAGYGAVRVLHDVSVRVADGETVVLLGTNGNGKSTLLKCIAGLVTPDRGAITLEASGEKIELVGKTPEAIVGLGVALVPEGRRLFPALSVEQNLLLGAYRRAARRQIAGNLELVYAVFPVLKERRRQPAGSMSGGEQQMVALGRALMSAPKLLLIDEPSVGLAPILVSRVIARISELKARTHLTVMMAEQNFNQAIKIADRAYVMVHGRIEFEGQSAAELQDNPMIKRYYLGA